MLHGKGKDRGIIPLNKSSKGVWYDIHGINKDFVGYGLDLKARIGCRLGSGDSVSFWKDNWATVNPLSKSFPLAYKASCNKLATVKEMWKNEDGIVKWGIKEKIRNNKNSNRILQELKEIRSILEDVIVTERGDLWGWESEDSFEGSVKIVRESLEASKAGLHPIFRKNFDWCGWAPAKVNLFAWRELLGKIATYDQLIKRGVRIAATRCPLCKTDLETSLHVLRSCNFAKVIWEKVENWTNCKFLASASNLAGGLNWKRSNIVESKPKKKAFQVVLLATLWKIWEARNDSVFRNGPKDPTKILDDIRETSLLWINCRANLPLITLSDWGERGLNVFV